MSRESSKTKGVTPAWFYKTYLSGKVIDIGCGNDVVTPEAEPFDVQHGDAGNILKFRSSYSYDSVHSSHCLEHMEDPVRSLMDWWELLKIGGHLVLIVPDESLYEQATWPSIFNQDHKASFRLGGKALHEKSFDIEELVTMLPGVMIISIERQDQRYNHRFKKYRIGCWGRTLFVGYIKIFSFLQSVGIKNSYIYAFINEFFHWLGSPIDQTLGDALAQIRVVAKKR
jgi:SAM-dependent methyltransferase